MSTAIRLPPLPSINDLLKIYRLRARKQLAQNFLFDERLTNKIVKQVGNVKNGQVIEVGPGPGCLTRSIIKKFPERLIVVEKDKRFKPTLEMLAEAFATVNGKMEILYDDIMRANLTSLFPEESRNDWNDRSPNIYIIGNLPFNVSTPLIIQWLQAISTRSGPWAMGRVRMCLTFQKEVAERLVSEAEDRQRCRLSVMAQAWTQPKLRFIIPGHVFIPKPDVDVGVVTFEPLINPRTNHEFSFFEKITRHMFSFRRKYFIRGVETLFPPDYTENLAVVMCKLADVDPRTRPMKLTVEDIDRLCSAYKYLIEKHPEIKDYDYRASRRVLPKSWTVRVEIKDLEESKMPITNPQSPQIPSSC